MAEFIKTSRLSHGEIVAAFERISNDYKKETAENADLKKSLAYFRTENERLERRIVELKKQLDKK